jgi:hypothetical protein
VKIGSKVCVKSDRLPWAPSKARRRRRSFMYKTTSAVIEKLFNEGKSEQEVIAAKPLADLDEKWAADPQQATNWVRMVYNSFKRS